MLLAAGVVVAASLPAVAAAAPGQALAIDNGQQIVATLAAILTLAMASRSGSAEARRVVRGLAATLVLAAAGLLLWYLQPGGSATDAGWANAVFIAAVAVLAISLGRPVFGGLENGRAATVALDAGIVVIATATTFGSLWQGVLNPAGRGDQAAMAVVGSLVLIAGPVAAFLALLNRRVQPGVRGAYAVIDGITLVGLAWIGWLTLAAEGATSTVAWSDFAFSVGVLLFAYGGVTWDLRAPASPAFDRFATEAAEAFPLLAVALCVVIDLLTPEVAIFRAGTGAVILLALVRQMLLTRSERRARRAERAASARLAREILARSTVLRSLARLDAADTPEETARRICLEAIALDGIHAATVRVFGPDGEASVFGAAGLADVSVAANSLRLPEARLVERAAGGPWVETLADAARPEAGSPAGPRLRSSANAPLSWNDRIIGLVALSTADDATEAELAERLTTAREFGVLAGALLGPALEERARLAALRDVIVTIIDEGRFHPVFQPIVDLATDSLLGFEALTRFDDGERPDVRFANAVAAGLGLELETACLRAALCDAIALPEGTYLSLNVSPALAAALLPLVAILEQAEREIVLEITEHVQVASYAGLRAALASLRAHVRIAVDDAGAGYAGLQHILELRPDIVKLDIALVRSVDQDPVRRALISSMVAFAREASSTLLAEGIETDAERQTLQRLGVTLGQGYLLGRPVPIEAI